MALTPQEPEEPKEPPTKKHDTTGCMVAIAVVVLAGGLWWL